MRVTKLFCDRCGKECKHLYDVPRFEIEGYNISVYNGNGKREYCETCARELIKAYKEWGKN